MNINLHARFLAFYCWRLLDDEAYTCSYSGSFLDMSQHWLIAWYEFKLGFCTAIVSFSRQTYTHVPYQ